MNVVLDRDTHKTWFTVRGATPPWTDGEPNGLTLRIHRQSCGEALPTQTSTNCSCNVSLWFDNHATFAGKVNPEVTLEYDVLDVTADKFAVYWDDLVHDLPSGRYKASLVDKDNYTIGGFNIIIPKGAVRVSAAKHSENICN